MRHLLLHDPVTGLANRALLEDRTSQALKHAQRKRLAFSVAVFRIDRFDTVELVARARGHRQAPRGARPAAAARGPRRGHARATSAAARFAALLPGAAGPAEATAAVSSILAAVGEPLHGRTSTSSSSP